MKTSDKIKAIKDTGISAYYVAKVTGIPESTVDRIWNGTTSVQSIRLDTAEKLADLYDKVESTLYKAIAVLDVMAVNVFEKGRIAPLMNPNLNNYLYRKPFDWITKVHGMVIEPQYLNKLMKLPKLENELMEVMADIEPNNLYENFKLNPNMHTFYIAKTRQYLLNS